MQIVECAHACSEHLQETKPTFSGTKQRDCSKSIKRIESYSVRNNGCILVIMYPFLKVFIVFACPDKQTKDFDP